MQWLKCSPVVTTSKSKLPDPRVEALEQNAPPPVNFIGFAERIYMPLIERNVYIQFNKVTLRIA